MSDSAGKQWGYWNGPDLVDRRVKYAADFRPEYQANGDNLQARFRAAISYVVGQHGLVLPEEEWASGWRPPGVNEVTANAAKKSTHLTAEGGDRKDTVDGSLAWGLMKDPHPLEVHGLYMEHPVATVVRSWERAFRQYPEPGKVGVPTPWCHAQMRPLSVRVFFPDTASVAEWDAFLKIGGYVGISFADWCVLRRQGQKKGKAAP